MADQAAKPLPVGFTAYARTEDRLRVLRSGFQAHIPKPIEPTELIVAIAGLVAEASRSSDMCATPKFRIGPI